MSNWRQNPWYVLKIAMILDITPQAVREMEWSEIQDRLGEDGIYRVARGMRGTTSLSAEYYTKSYIQELRKRGKL